MRPIRNVYHAMTTYDKRHMGSAIFDTVGAIAFILFITLIRYGIEQFMDDTPTLNMAILQGALNAGYYYLGIVVMVGLLSTIFSTLSPYRHVLSSLLVIVGVVLFFTIHDSDIGIDTQQFVTLMVLGIVALIAVGGFLRILISESSVAVRFRELREEASNHRHHKDH